MSNYEIIKQAILNKRPIVATYDKLHRVLCVHVLGNKDGTYLISALQIDGESESKLSKDPADNWRTMRLSGLCEIAFADNYQWTTPSNYNPPGKTFKDAMGLIYVPK